MAYRLAIDDLVGVTIQGKNICKDGAEKPFKFVLVCDRLGADAMKQTVSNKEETVIEFFERHARDWQGQRLVLDDQGNPAAFSLDSLRVLMSITGMGMLAWHSYLLQVQATAKN